MSGEVWVLCGVAWLVLSARGQDAPEDREHEAALGVQGDPGPGPGPEPEPELGPAPQPGPATAPEPGLGRRSVPGRHLPYREVAPRRLGTRRLFGPDTKRVGEGDTPRFLAACALQDWRGVTRCSCGVVAARWALTAAHCAREALRQVMQQDGAVTFYTPIIYLFAHPEYHVQVVDEGQGEDVAELRHDVGLVQVAQPLRSPPPLVARLPDLALLATQNELVQVFGFGRTEAPGVPHELHVATLRLLECGRGGAWLHCACAASDSAPARNSGVCAGDSGGPVLWNGVQVGVTSMGPVECRADTGVPQMAVSVLTSLAQYQELLYRTMGVEMATTTEIDPKAMLNSYLWNSSVETGEKDHAQPQWSTGEGARMGGDEGGGEAGEGEEGETGSAGAGGTGGAGDAGDAMAVKMVRSSALDQVENRVASAAPPAYLAVRPLLLAGTLAARALLAPRAFAPF